MLKTARHQKAAGIMILAFGALYPLTFLAPGFRATAFCLPAARLSAALLGTACLPAEEGYMIAYPALPIWVSLACSGVSFFVLLIAMWAGLLYRYRRLSPGMLVAMATSAYGVTVLANTGRITLGFHAALWARRLLPESMWAGVHMSIGILVFLCALVGAYAVLEWRLYYEQKTA